MPDNPDPIVLRRATAGDADAFAVLVDRYAAPIYRVCFSILGNQADAQDCVQETFLKAFCTIATFRQSSAFYTWLYRIAANCCYDVLRRRTRHPMRSLDEPEDAPDGEIYLQLADDRPLPDETLASKETVSQVRAAIAGLPENLRRILVLRDIEDLSYEDIARLEGLRAGTVKSRLFRARLLLAERLRQLEAAPGPASGAGVAKAAAHADGRHSGNPEPAGNKRLPFASNEQQDQALTMRRTSK